MDVMVNFMACVGFENIYFLTGTSFCNVAVRMRQAKAGRSFTFHIRFEYVYFLFQHQLVEIWFTSFTSSRVSVTKFATLATDSVQI